MGKINLLDRQVADLIAAGEVVERPASVVKELVENAVDAGATSVTVEIKNGGTSFIRVTDNGSGILREDTKNAFVRHATSKISKASDLEAISTLGFRGEALASIAAVAKVELITRTKDEEAGTHLLMEGGELVLSEDIGCPQGTTVIVRELFFNTPARLKFLKKNITEAGAVTGVIENAALADPGISMKFIKDGRESLFTPGDNSLASVVYKVFGRELAKEMLPVSYTYQNIDVSGLVSRPVSCRPNRNRQHFFVNSRSIRSRTIAFALEEAYKSRISPERYPAAVLKIDLNHALVDANVHPTKTEVKFVDERAVYDAVYFAVQNALLSERRNSEIKLPSASSRPLGHVPFPQAGETQPQQTFFGSLPKQSADNASVLKNEMPTNQDIINETRGQELKKPLFATDITDRSHLLESSKDTILEPYSKDYTVIQKQSVSCLETNKGIEDSSDGYGELPEQNAAGSDWRLIGEAFGTYIIVEKGDELMLIDKHAAHERMIYERLKKSRRQGSGQVLLAPRAVALTPQEAATVLDNKERFEEMGFMLEDFGQGTILVREIPAELSGCDPSEILCGMASEMMAGSKEPMSRLWERALYSAACKAAVKGNSIGRTEELTALVTELFKLPSLRYCPHGRPITIILSRHNIEKQFKRA